MQFVYCGYFFHLSVSCIFTNVHYWSFTKTIVYLCTFVTLYFCIWMRLQYIIPCIHFSLWSMQRPNHPRRLVLLPEKNKSSSVSAEKRRCVLIGILRAAPDVNRPQMYVHMYTNLLVQYPFLRAYNSLEYWPVPPVCPSWL